MEQQSIVSSRDYTLDGIRGIACLIVLLSHFMQFFLPSVFFPKEVDHFGEKFLSQTPVNILYNGQFAVMIFFVLSGMVLSIPFFKGKNVLWYSKSIIKRYPRLAIPTIASTILSFTLMITIGFHQTETAVFSLSHAIPSMPTDTTFFNAVWEGSVGTYFYGIQTLNPVLWTIQTELYGSILILVLVPILCVTRARFLFYLLGISVFSSSHIVGFVLGVICADISINIKKIYTPFIALMIVIGIYLGSYPYFITPDSIWINSATITTFNFKIMSQAFGSMFIIIALDKAVMISKIFRTKTCKFLGDISYSLYLVHFPLIASVSSLLVVVLCENGASYGLSLVISLIVTVILSIAIAYIFKITVDDNAIKLANIITKKILPQRSIKYSSS